MSNEKRNNDEVKVVLSKEKIQYITIDIPL